MKKFLRKDPVKKKERKGKKTFFMRTLHPMGKLRDLHYELLEHPPYSPDLAPSDFCLFQKLKLFLAGQRFSLNQEAIAAV
jgi:hypothetical protein